MQNLSAGIFTTAIVLVATTAALGDAPGKEKVKFNTADQAAARATVLRLVDLGSGDWKGGVKKPDLSPGPVCANYHPKQSDLVLTGAAVTDFSDASGREIDSGADVLQTARMVQLDWQRSFAPAALPGSAVKFVSFRRIAFPLCSRARRAERKRSFFCGSMMEHRHADTHGVISTFVRAKARTEAAFSIA